MTKIYTVIKIAGTCPFCGQHTEVTVPARGYRLWQEGELIQNAMPELSPEARETLISCLCPTCQARFFGPTEDEEEEDWEEEDEE